MFDCLGGRGMSHRRIPGGAVDYLAILEHVREVVGVYMERGRDGSHHFELALEPALVQFGESGTDARYQMARHKRFRISRGEPAAQRMGVGEGGSQWKSSFQPGAVDFSAVSISGGL